MLVTVTHPKAPWPAGAVVGSVVALPHEAMPAWAVGKCVQAEEGAEAQFTWEPPADPAPLSLAPPVGAAPAALTAEQANKLAELQALLDAERQASGELKAMLEAEQAKTAALTAEVEALKAAAAGGNGAAPKTPAKAGAAKG